MPKVEKQLLARENKRPPACNLDPRADEYGGRQIKAALDCWRLAWAKAAGKHDLLAQAVEHRETKTEEAVKAAIR